MAEPCGKIILLKSCRILASIVVCETIHRDQMGVLNALAFQIFPAYDSRASNQALEGRWRTGVALGSSRTRAGGVSGSNSRQSFKPHQEFVSTIRPSEIRFVSFELFANFVITVFVGHKQLAPETRAHDEVSIKLEVFQEKITIESLGRSKSLDEILLVARRGYSLKGEADRIIKLGEILVIFRACRWRPTSLRKIDGDSYFIDTRLIRTIHSTGRSLSKKGVVNRATNGSEAQKQKTTSHWTLPQSSPTKTLKRRY